MKSKFSFLALACAMAFSLNSYAQSGAAAPGASAPPTKIGIINIQDAIFSTNEGQRDLQALNTKYAPKQQELQKQKTDLDELQKRLSTQGDKLNEDERNALVKQIDQKQRALQQNADSADSDYSGEGNDIATRIGKKFMDVLNKFAKENGYAVILDVSSQSSNVLWACTPGAGAPCDKNSIDVTEAVVALYNQQSGIAAPAAPAGATGASRPAGSSTGAGAGRSTAPPASKPTGASPATGTAPKPTGPGR